MHAYSNITLHMPPNNTNVIHLSLGENFFEKKLFPEPLSKNFMLGKITDYVYLTCAVYVNL